MALEFENHQGKTPKYKAVRVTETNLAELTTWMGFDAYSITRFIGEDSVDHPPFVYFQTKRDKDGDSGHPHFYINAVGVEIGGWIVEVEDKDYGHLIVADKHFKALSDESFRDLVPYTGFSTAAPYDR